MLVRFRPFSRAGTTGHPIMREAVIHIPHDEFERIGLERFVSLCLDAGLRDLEELVCETDGCLVAVTVESRLAEESLDGIDRVEWWERLAADDEVVYLCKLAFPDGESGAAMHGPSVSNELQVNDDGLDVALVGTQEDISRELGEYADAGMRVLLRRLTDYRGPGHTLDSLTDRQREVLETAYDLGYFDVPRRVSTADVAAELDLDPSTVAEHLQRAEHNLFTALLDSP